MPPRRLARNTNATTTSAQASPTKGRSAKNERNEGGSVNPEKQVLRRSARAASAESSASIEHGNPSKRQRTEAGGGKDLPPVAEEPENRRRSRKVLRSPGVASNISGTTARTSNSAIELGELDSESMLDNLPDLYDVSGKILDLCAPRNLSSATFSGLTQKLGDPASRTHKTFKKFKRTFDKVIGSYTTEHYIDLALVLRGLLSLSRSDEVGNGPWRPDEVFFKANLASTVGELLSHETGLESSDMSFEKLDRDFPERFLSGVVPTGSDATGFSVLLEDSFTIGLELRTQFAIHALHEFSGQPDFNPSSVVRQSFYERDNGPLRGWSARGLQGSDLSEAHKHAISSRTSEMIGHFDSNEHSTGLDNIRARYAFSRFLSKFLAWARARDDEIIQSMQKLDQGQGVGYGAQLALENELIRRKALSTGEDPIAKGYVELNYQPSSDAIYSESSDQAQVRNIIPRVPSKNKFNTPTGIEMFKKITQTKFTPNLSPSSFRAKLGAGTAKGFVGVRDVGGMGRKITSTAPAATSRLQEIDQEQPPSSAGPTSAQQNQSQIDRVDENVGGDDPDLGLTPMDDDDTSNHVQGEGDTSTILPSKEEREQIVAMHRNLEKEQDKENAPPQATRGKGPKGKIFERQTDAERVEFDSQSSQHANASRGSGTSEEDSQSSDFSDEEAFERDQRASPVRTQVGRKRRQAPAATGSTSAKRVRISQPEPVVRSSTHKASATPVLGTQTPSQVYQQVNERAKSITNQRNTKPVQTRKAWTELEVNTLIELIEEYGCSWAKLKTVDDEQAKQQDTRPVLEHRNQVALKDKARNMKFDYLKAGTPLPTNFDLIPLKQSQKEVLGDYGAAVEV